MYILFFHHEHKVHDFNVSILPVVEGESRQPSFNHFFATAETVCNLMLAS